MNEIELYKKIVNIKEKQGVVFVLDVEVNPYKDTFYMFLFLSTYGGKGVLLRTIEQEFNNWLKSQRRGLNKQEIKSNFLDIYPKSGSYTISDIILECTTTDDDFICVFDNYLYLRNEAKEYVVNILIEDLEDYKKWINRYIKSVEKVPFKNITDDIYWLVCHYYLRTSPEELGGNSLGSVAENWQENVNKHIFLQSKNSELHLIIQPKLYLDFELIGIDRNLIKCKVEIQELSYEEEFSNSISPFPNKLIVLSLPDSEFFRAIPITSIKDKIIVKYIWSIESLTVKHNVTYIPKGKKGTCYYDRMSSFITHKLSPEMEFDYQYLQFKYPYLVSFDVDTENKVISINEEKTLKRLYPSNPPFQLHYLPTSKYN